MSTLFGEHGVGEHEYPGLVKVKLIHAHGVSLIVPDQLYLADPQVWFMPCTFLPSMLVKDDNGINCALWCDLADGHTVSARFSDKDHVRSLADGSHLYHCTINGPDNITSSGAGRWTMLDDAPHLRLYHHTHKAAYQSILDSGEFWSSSWNIQGVRKLMNVGYVYFTSLERIRTEGDLAAIAMSPNRMLHFLRDGAVQPRALPPHWKSTPLANDILEVEVYWSEPEKRDHTVSLWVDSRLIAPHHVLRHDTRTIWYEVSCPAILRVGVAPGKALAFGENGFLPGQPYKTFDYMVIGDATTIAGLAAPLDEENTTSTFKIHRTAEPPLEFWFNNANTDHYTPLTVNEQKFEPDG